MYKNQLQELAQRSCFNLPSYSCIREGPDHAPRFKATVNFNGEIFESPTFCSTLRQAEHAAAEVALNTLASRGPSRALAARVLVSFWWKCIHLFFQIQRILFLSTFLRTVIILVNDSAFVLYILCISYVHNNKNTVIIFQSGWMFSQMLALGKRASCKWV